MNKADACRAAIVAALPELARDPDRLMIWADKGRIAVRRTKTFGYEWRYRLNLLLEAFTASPDAVMMPLMLWLREAQPDLVASFIQGDDAVHFEAHILDANSCDLLLQFELSEPVLLNPREGGGYDITHLEPPSADDLLLDGAPTLHELWLGGSRLLPRDPE